MPKLYNVEAEVHKQIPQGYRVKVFIRDIGIYINGMVVMPPNGNKDWSVYPPAERKPKNVKSKKWSYYVEFDTHLPLHGEIVEACIDAVKLEMSYQKSDDVITDFDENEPINLDDIPF